jgi:hypothetical protein
MLLASWTGSRGRKPTLAADAARKPDSARARQFVYHPLPASDSHQECLGRSPHLWPHAGSKAEVGGDQPHTTDAPGAADVRGYQGNPQRGQQPPWRYDARRSECAPDVLMMDEPLGQGDPAAQRTGQPRGCR